MAYRRDTTEATAAARAAPRGLTAEEKLLRYSKVAEDGSGCRVWIGGTAQGYGHIRIGSRQARAHRVALELKLGRPIKPGLVACHSCHNPLCVNPEHLREGDQQSNLDECAAADRTAFGARNANTKLTVQQVRAIRRDPRTITAIAQSLGVTRRTVQMVKCRITWKRVT